MLTTLRLRCNVPFTNYIDYRHTLVGVSLFFLTILCLMECWIYSSYIHEFVHPHQKLDGLAGRVVVNSSQAPSSDPSYGVVHGLMGSDWYDLLIQKRNKEDCCFFFFFLPFFFLPFWVVLEVGGWGLAWRSRFMKGSTCPKSWHLYGKDVQPFPIIQPLLEKSNEQ